VTIFEAIVLGAVQGLTEFFPVSSTGHLEIFHRLFGLEADLSFDLFVHVATLIAVAIFFWRELLRLTPKTIGLLVIGTIPVGIVGFFFKDAIEALFVVKFLVFEMLVNAAICFVIDRILEKRKKVAAVGLVTDVTDVSYKHALVVGAFQVFGLSPGVTRSGSTVLGALTQKLDRSTAFTFSFLLSLPAVGAASLLQFVDAYQEGFVGIQPIPYLAGFVAALISGLLSLFLFRMMLQKARMEHFGYYCLAVAAVVFALSYFG
jgi:undecaprenyl-diphosphatase